ncbi:carboxypeptidase-like regulatory domain-containing protein [Flavobacterium sp. F-65]|uniref:Carboxypeptidase-like regulatory domain-containing protein n=1 Tax=Flavobacterium pisciphilum TaxID=2893755 RepID=A0ABS8MT41_9FLAO|nr:carboxypeptidase-like regulatory domain-containing protein [Flavobacterium sp. F-65]MCC9071952.1 carboxypeptidase-like regulatory domain-containing protein [Flavobacterium sp. F-65]
MIHKCYQNEFYLKKAIYLLFFLLTIKLHSQNTITGKIINSKNIPVDQATVQIKNITTDHTIAFIQTDKYGFYKLEIKEKASYNIKITAFGYATLIKRIEIDKKNLNLEDIFLEENRIELKNVIIKNENKGITEIGDTLRYKVEKFMNGTEETLKDVIKKLPGLDIDQQGKIKANGKSIDKLLIDGEEFFINQQKIATENISSEMIKNIELIKNYTEFKNLKTNEKSDITAININIKEKFKNKITGNIETGLGNDSKYKLHSTLFSFRKKLLASLISDSNNTGQLSISIDDYLNFVNQKEENTNGETTFTRNDELPRFLTIGNNVQKRSSYFTGLNLKYSPIKKIQINFYSIINNTDQIEQQSITQQYFTEPNPIVNREIKSISEKSKINISHLDIAAKLNDKSLLNYKASFSGLDNNNKSEIENNSNLISNQIEFSNFDLTHQFNFNTIFKKDNGLSLNLKQNILESKNDLNINSNNEFLNLIFKDSNYEIIQKTKTHKNEIALKANYFFKLKFVNFNLFFESDTKKEFFQNNEIQFSQFDNRIDLNKKSNNAGFDTKFKLFKKTTFTSSLSYSKINYIFNDETSSKTFFAPKFTLKKEFDSNHYLKLSYSKNNNLVKVDNLIQNEIIGNYRTIFTNQDIKFDMLFPNQYIAADYYYSKNRFSLIANTSYLKSKNIISSNSISTSTLTTFSYKLAPLENRFNSLLFLEKTFSKIPFSVRGSASYSESNKDFFYNNQNQSLNSKSISGYFSILSRFKETSFQIEAGYLYVKDNYRDELSSNYLSVLNPYTELSYKFSEEFSFVTKFSYKKFMSRISSNDIYELNPKFRYVFPKSKVEISIIGYDILNIKNNQQISLSRFDNYTEENIYKTLSGYFMLNLKLKL